MNPEAIESKFLASAEKGEVSSLLMRPPDAEWLLVLGHGASTHMRHANLETIAQRFMEEGVATFRYNFPYAETGSGRNSNAVCQETARAAVAAAQQAAGDLKILAGGHSFSGRMTSLAFSEEPIKNVRGLVFLGFPLHPAGKRATDRADHLDNIDIPLLFLTGTRDKLAELELLRPVCKRLGDKATLHLLDTADHGFKTLKRSRASEEDVFEEMARVAKQWASCLGD